MTDNGTQPTPSMAISIGCDGGQYYIETLPEDLEDRGVYTMRRHINPAQAADIWNGQYRLNNVKSSLWTDDRNWSAQFFRVVDVPQGEWDAAMAELRERNQQGVSAGYGEL